MQRRRPVFVENEALPPEVSALLQAAAETCPASAIHAGHLLKILCRPGLAGMKSGRPAPVSLLTPSGYPLEFTFRSASSDLVYTAEPGLPQASSAAKWRFVRKLDEKLDLRLHPLLPTLVAQPAQRFGCWLGVRHREGVRRFKIYQEVGPQTSSWILHHLRCAVPGLGDATELSPNLLGVVPGIDGATEYYCRVEHPGPAVLHKLYAAADMGRLLSGVIDYLAYLAAVPREKLFGRLRIGISYNVASGRTPHVTLFVHACQLFDDNRQARLRWLGLVRQLGGQAAIYDKLTRVFEEADSSAMVHGLVGIGINETGRIECSVGLRPFK